MLRFSLGKFVILVGPDWGTTIVTLSGARRRIGEPDILRLNSSHFWSRPTIISERDSRDGKHGIIGTGPARNRRSRSAGDRSTWAVSCPLETGFRPRRWWRQWRRRGKASKTRQFAWFSPSRFSVDTTLLHCTYVSQITHLEEKPAVAHSRVPPNRPWRNCAECWMRPSASESPRVVAGPSARPQGRAAGDFSLSFCRIFWINISGNIRDAEGWS
jgi:hypothetical protein